jgi:hypothetical protein
MILRKATTNTCANTRVHTWAKGASAGTLTVTTTYSQPSESLEKAANGDAN